MYLAHPFGEGGNAVVGVLLALEEGVLQALEEQLRLQDPSGRGLGHAQDQVIEQQDVLLGVLEHSRGSTAEVRIVGVSGSQSQYTLMRIALEPPGGICI